MILTGIPGVGKTTLLLKIIAFLKLQDFRVGGMISREIRENGSRVGFEILNVESGKRSVLAGVKGDSGPKLGRYRVNLANLETVGVEAIKNAIDNSGIIAVDEIGPMELFSDIFKSTVEKALQSQKPLIIIVHWKANDPLISKIKNRKDATLFTVTIQNREQLERDIIEKTLEYIHNK